MPSKPRHEESFAARTAGRCSVVLCALSLAFIPGCVTPRRRPRLTRFASNPGTLDQSRPDQSLEGGRCRRPDRGQLARHASMTLSSTPLVAEAMTNNPDLRVTATRVEQAAQYVELAKAALRPQ